MEEPKVITIGDVMDSTVMHINKGNAHGTQGERSNPANSAEHILLALSRHFRSGGALQQSFAFRLVPFEQIYRCMAMLTSFADMLAFIVPVLVI